MFDILEILQPGRPQLTGSLEPLFGADLPFIDGTALSDMLDFGGTFQDRSGSWSTCRHRRRPGALTRPPSSTQRSPACRVSS